MTIREAIRQQQKSIKNRSAKEQLAFFWEYYGIKTICLVAAVALLVAFIVSLATKKPYGFTGVFFGAAAQEDAQSYLSDFGRCAGIDPEDFELTVQLSPDIRMDQQITPEIYQSMEGFTAMVASNSVDCFAANRELFLYYAYMEYAVDLRTVLTGEELSRLAPYLHYIDGSLLAQQELEGDGYASAFSQRPDSAKPELMGDPIPVAVDLTAATNEFSNAYRFAGDGVLGICASTEQPQNALAFLRYCLGLSPAA